MKAVTRKIPLLAYSGERRQVEHEKKTSVTSAEQVDLQPRLSAS